MSEQIADGHAGQLSFFAPKVTPPAFDILFDSFWLAYPKRPNNSKQAARVAYQRALAHATAAEINVGLLTYEFSPDPKFRPMACTWLNQRRWACIRIDLSLDPWGLSEHIAALPASDAMSAAAYEIDALHAIMLATGWAETWRGALDALDTWLRDGYEPMSVASVISDAVGQHGVRSSLTAFDRVVRARAARFDAATFRYKSAAG